MAPAWAGRVQVDIPGERLLGGSSWTPHSSQAPGLVLNNWGDAALPSLSGKQILLVMEPYLSSFLPPALERDFGQ